MDRVVPVREVQGTPADDKWTGRETAGVIVGWILSIGLWIFIGFYLSCGSSGTGSVCKFVDSTWFWILTIAVYIGYIVNAATSPVRKYLSNQLQESCKEYVAKLVQQPPKLMWYIQCYHYETRTTTDSKGHTHTQQVRVDTHSATGTYSYASWRDISPPIQIPMGPNLLRMRLEKEREFADSATQQNYDSAFAAWVRANDRDVYKDVSEDFLIDGFEDYVLSRERGGGCSCMASSAIFWIFTILTLYVFYNHFFFCTTTPFDVKLVKTVSIYQQAADPNHYAAPPGMAMGPPPMPIPPPPPPPMGPGSCQMVREQLTDVLIRTNYGQTDPTTFNMYFRFSMVPGGPPVCIQCNRTAEEHYSTTPDAGPGYPTNDQVYGAV